MTEFYFGDNCTFCQSRIGSTHCLLPYQLVVGYVPPPDDMSKIIDITEIHMRYGLEFLQTNLESINWINNRPGSIQSQVASSSVRSESNRWSDQMNSLSEQLHSKITSVSANTMNSDLESNYSDFISRQLHFENDDGVPVASPASYAAATSIDVKPTVKSKLGKEVVYDEPEVLFKPKETKQPELSVIERYNIEQSRVNRNHLITDLVMIAKTAFNLHASQRDWIKTNALKESIMYESDLRSKMGAKYKPSMSTTLDGNKAFAKEIVARHQVEEVQDWESGKSTSHGLFCLLNCRFVSLPINENDQTQLSDELIKCFQAIIKPKASNKSYNQIVVDAVKFELSRDDYPSAFKWMENRAKFLETRDVSKVTSPISQGPSGKINKIKEPYPAIDERLIDFINTNLQVFVNREIESAKDEVPEMSDETKLSKFFFKLASEFLRRNKGWHNENSFTSPQHLVKLEELTGLRSQSSESSLTFSILKKIIDDFRISFKRRYPKSPS